MPSGKSTSDHVVVPDRFESLERKARDHLSTIVVPVDPALTQIDRIVATMAQAGRGAFLLLRGPSGAGKSTFLHTIRLYRKGISTTSVPGGVSIRSFSSRSHIKIKLD
jgi:pantothenate kinase-related protein Tda10